MKRKLEVPWAGARGRCSQCKTEYEEPKVGQTCDTCEVPMREVILSKLPSIDWVNAAFIGFMIACVLFLGYAVKVTGDKKTRLMTECMNDGKKEYICEHLLKDQTQTSYWFMNMGGR